MRRHALHVYLDELEAMDSTFGGGHLPGGHHGRGSPFRVGIAESEGKGTAPSGSNPFFYLPAHLRLPVFYPECPRLDIPKTLSCK